MEGQTLSEKSEKMIEAILESYKEYPCLLYTSDAADD